jgi:hypothetical protein
MELFMMAAPPNADLIVSVISFIVGFLAGTGWARHKQQK